MDARPRHRYWRWSLPRRLLAADIDPGANRVLDFTASQRWGDGLTTPTATHRVAADDSQVDPADDPFDHVRISCPGRFSPLRRDSALLDSSDQARTSFGLRSGSRDF